MTCLLKIAQIQSFQQEIYDISNYKKISKLSKLVSLNQFIDCQGFLRMGGRLVNAPVPYDQRHPVILPGQHPLTELIIRYKHVTLLH